MFELTLFCYAYLEIFTYLHWFFIIEIISLILTQGCRNKPDRPDRGQPSILHVLLLTILRSGLAKIRSLVGALLYDKLDISLIKIEIISLILT